MGLSVFISGTDSMIQLFLFWFIITIIQLNKIEGQDHVALKNKISLADYKSLKHFREPDFEESKSENARLLIDEWFNIYQCRCIYYKCVQLLLILYMQPKKGDKQWNSAVIIQKNWKQFITRRNYLKKLKRQKKKVFTVMELLQSERTYV